MSGNRYIPASTAGLADFGEIVYNRADSRHT